MKRLYFLAGSPHAAERIADTLQREGVRPDHIHLVSTKEHLADRLGVKPASMEETSDVQSARKRGIIAGAATGVVAGLTITLIPGGIVLGGGAIALAGLIGASLGMTLATIIGGSEENPVYGEYEKRIRRGEVLIAVDTDATQADRITRIIHGVDPKIEVKERTLTQVETQE